MKGVVAATTRGDSASVSKRATRRTKGDGMLRKGRFSVTCRRADGSLRWHREMDNLVVDVGLNDSLDKHLKGSGYTASWFVGVLSASPTVAAADTSATHAGWTEITAYDEASRPALTLGAVASQSVDNSASPAVFTMNGAGTMGGAFIISDNTKGGATGILYSAGAFTEGDTGFAASDVINVQWTATTAAA